MVSNPQVSHKVLMGFILLSLITIVWTSYAIINNPYTFPAKFWLYFMTGFVTYVIILMIDNITNLELIKTFQYIVIAVSLLLNALLIANIYTKYFTLPPNIITVIIALNGFMSGYILNYMLSFDPNKLKKTSIGTSPSVVGTLSPSISGTTVTGTTVGKTVGTGTVTMAVTKSPTGTITLTPTVGTGTTPISTLTTTPASPGVVPNIPQARSLNTDVYDFGAFDLTEERADTPDSDYFRDFAAQYRDEEELNSDDYIEDDYIEDDYIEDDYIEDDFIEDDYAEEDYIEDDFTEEY